MSQVQKSFEAVLLEAVDDSLKNHLGQSVRALIYFRVERDHSLRKDEIPQRLGDFFSTIQGIFGEGAAIVEKWIVERLCEELGVNYENVKDQGFPVAVEEVRKRSIAHVQD